jgi:prevent-host-death family protein
MYKGGMSIAEEVSITDARPRIGELAKRVARTRDHILLTSNDIPAAVLVNPEELAELQERVVVAELRAARAEGTALPGVPLAEVRARLGL